MNTKTGYIILKEHIYRGSGYRIIRIDDAMVVNKTFIIGKGEDKAWHCAPLRCFYDNLTLALEEAQGMVQED